MIGRTDYKCKSRKHTPSDSSRSSNTKREEDLIRDNQLFAASLQSRLFSSLCLQPFEDHKLVPDTPNANLRKCDPKKQQHNHGALPKQSRPSVHRPNVLQRNLSVPSPSFDNSTHIQFGYSKSRDNRKLRPDCSNNVINYNSSPSDSSNLLSARKVVPSTEGTGIPEISSEPTSQALTRGHSRIRTLTAESLESMVEWHEVESFQSPSPELVLQPYVTVSVTETSENRIIKPLVLERTMLSNRVKTLILERPTIIPEVQIPVPDTDPSLMTIPVANPLKCTQEKFKLRQFLSFERPHAIPTLLAPASPTLARVHVYFDFAHLVKIMLLNGLSMLLRDLMFTPPPGLLRYADSAASG